MSPEEQLAGRVARVEANVASMQADLERLAQQPIETARLSERVAGLEHSQARIELKLDRRLDEIERLIEEDKRDHRDEVRQREQERKLDRRWLVGTVFSSAALIIAALGLLLGTQ